MGKKLPSDILKYLVLDIFTEGPSYGYEVVSRIEDITEGYWSPSYGTIYPLIQRLEEEGLLRELSDEEVEERGLDNGDRKYFELTEEGEDEFCYDGEKEEHRDKFRDLIMGYLKIYRSKYGEESMDDFSEEF